MEVIELVLAKRVQRLADVLRAMGRTPKQIVITSMYPLWHLKEIVGLPIGWQQQYDSMAVNHYRFLCHVWCLDGLAPGFECVEGRLEVG